MVNPSKNKTVKLKGNMSYQFDDKEKDPNPNGNITVNLSNPESKWEGDFVMSYFGVTKDRLEEVSASSLKVTGAQINLSNGATFTYNPTDPWQDQEGSGVLNGAFPLAVSSLALDNGNIVISNPNDMLLVNKLSGKGKLQLAAELQEGKLTSARFIVGTRKDPALLVTPEGENSLRAVSSEPMALANDASTAATIPTENHTENYVANPDGAKGAVLNVSYTGAGINSDNISPTQFTELAKDSVQILGGTAEFTIAEGSVNDAMVLEMNQDGQTGDVSFVSPIHFESNTVKESLKDISGITFLSMRSTMNDVSKRLGDLRSYEGLNGLWARYIGGQQRYDSMKYKHNGFQMGFDHRINDWYVGALFGYTDGKGNLNNGSSKNDYWNFGLYGGWLGSKGQFVDVIVKRMRFNNDFNLHYTGGERIKGSYNNWATSFSIEAGWRLSSNRGYFVEPQTEFSFGHLESGSFKTDNGVSIKQKSANSTVGRLGVAVGYSFPEKKGDAYLKASVLHDWSAKIKGTMSKDSNTNTFEKKLDGTWGEFGVGATYNPTKNLSAYAEVSTSAGSPVRAPWNVSAGLRYNF